MPIKSDINGIEEAERVKAICAQAQEIREKAEADLTALARSVAKFSPTIEQDILDYFSDMFGDTFNPLREDAQDEIGEREHAEAYDNTDSLGWGRE